jgi:cell division transport system ATP-binding protein
MLSTGEQQRVGIARAVVARPKLLIADEPTGNLDPELSLDIMNLFRRFNDVGVTMLIATHDIELLNRVGGRRVVLADGQLRHDGHGGSGDNHSAGAA